ncbi:Chromosome (plasmid) partitioning protein ParA / Sporulation initiation inhibitor protein Soj [Planococcus halocryophilus Or1]|nr:Chromosome (plasmid) partitioning protein ParA / Sporulation initiation inhibitor protein Soj [Planococcus halocryophilus Or1]
MERFKSVFDITGITDADMHDRRVHESYKEIAGEFISRLNTELEGAENK